MNQKNILKSFFYSIEKSLGNSSYRFYWRYFGKKLSGDFMTWEIIWGLVAVKFVGDLYFGIYLEILLLGKLFGD